MKDYLRKAYIARRFIHGDIEPLKFDKVIATDDEPRPAAPVMITRAVPRQTTFKRHAVTGLIKIAVKDSAFERDGYVEIKPVTAKVKE